MILGAVMVVIVW